VDASDEDEWSERNDEFTIRFRLNEVVREGETAEFRLVADVANVGLHSGETDEWTLFVPNQGIRAVDSEGIQNYTGDETDTVGIDIKAAGAGEGLDISESSANPGSSILVVDEDRDSEPYGVVIASFEAEDNDIEVRGLTYTVTIYDSGATFDEVVSDAWVEADGNEFDDFDVTLTSTST